MSCAPRDPVRRGEASCIFHRSTGETRSGAKRREGGGEERGRRVSRINWRRLIAQSLATGGSGCTIVRRNARPSPSFETGLHNDPDGGVSRRESNRVSLTPSEGKRHP